MSKQLNIYKLIFINQGAIYEIYARKVHQSELYGFIEAEDFIFKVDSSIVVDPSQEKLHSEFNEVKKTMIPYSSIIRIDLVDKEGVAKAKELKSQGNITQFPMQNIPNSSFNNKDK